MAALAKHRRVVYLIALVAIAAAVTWVVDGENAERTIATGQPAAVRDAPPSPPIAPPLPFVYVGKVATHGATMAVLIKQDRNYVVRTGDTLDGIYGVEAIDDRRVVLKHLPLGIQQTLFLAAPDAQVGGVSATSAPPIGQRPGTAGPVRAAPISVRPGIDPVLAPPHPDPALAEEQ